MLDRLRADHPTVTFQIDETNDYRLFPFESVARGRPGSRTARPSPTGCSTTSGTSARTCPTHSLGQHVLGGRAYEQHPVDTLMAAAMPSHITLLQRPAPAARRRWSPRRRRGSRSTAPTATSSVAWPTRCSPTRSPAGGPRCSPGTPRAARARCSSSARAPPNRPSACRPAQHPAGRRFDLIEAPTGALYDTVTSKQLTAGHRHHAARARHRQGAARRAGQAARSEHRADQRRPAGTRVAGR